MAVFTRDHARREYLCALSREAPAVVEQLEEIARIPDPYAEGGGAEVFFRLGARNMAELAADTLAGREPDIHYLDERERPGLEWLVRWRLTDLWAVLWVEYTAKAWAARENLGEWAKRAPMAESFENPFTVPEQLRGWRPDRETWESWRGEMLAFLRRELSRYRARTLAEAKVVPIRKISEDHYRWTVKYHNFGQSFTEIARAHGKTGAHENSVREAVRRVAGLIGLTLRPTAKEQSARPKANAVR